jgi:hypothetical protein
VQARGVGAEVLEPLALKCRVLQMIKEMCKRVVFVKNLPKVISIDEVKELFDKYGEVAEVPFQPPSPKP